ncbi:LysR family transcriptional regulator [Pseudomonas monteilii]|uniref:LysR family transcriptional regulator n=1 Tax=Pseudomonas monteilii TaxID=76759 RepID=UPI00383BC24D
MNLKALKYAVEVAHTGSFTRAAQCLHVAQSALSMAIARLEQELGVTLFERNARGVTVTAEGERFLQRVDLTLQELACARQELSALNQLAAGEVRLGFAPMFGMGRLPLWLEQFHHRYPGVRFKALEGGGQEVGWRLESREIDVALMNTRRVKPHWRSAVVDADELIIGVSPANPLAHHETLTPECLHERPMVLLDGRFAQRVMLDEYCKQHGIAFHTVLESNDAPLVLQAAQRGLGATTIFRSNMHASSGLTGIPFEPPQHLQFSLCWRADEHLSLANRRFIEFVTGALLPVDARH